jgi:hypothetical protein
MRCVRVSIFLCKSKNITYYECVFVALLNQHATRMSHTMLSSVAFLVAPTVSTFSHKDTIFEKKKIYIYYWTENVFWISQQFLSEKSLIPSRIERDTFTNVQWCSCRVSVIFHVFSWNLNFLDRLSENTFISKFMKIRLIWSPVAPCGKTDMKKLIVACHNFANASNNTCAHAGVGSWHFTVIKC